MMIVKLNPIKLIIGLMISVALLGCSKEKTSASTKTPAMTPTLDEKLVGDWIDTNGKFEIKFQQNDVGVFNVQAPLKYTFNFDVEPYRLNIMLPDEGKSIAFFGIMKFTHNDTIVFKFSDEKSRRPKNFVDEQQHKQGTWILARK